MAEDTPGHRNRQARETEYQGIKFRSKLEAVWAAMFDELGWTWEYEPIETNGYIPDFRLRGAEGRAIYVEVKPLAIYEATQPLITEKAALGLGRDNDFLVLCDEFDVESIYSGSLVFGYMPFDDEQAILHAYGDEFDISHSWGSWEHRLSGRYAGDQYFNPVPAAHFYKIWSRARNRLQWKPRV